MNKTDLIAIAAQNAGMTKKDTERVINAALDAITAALVKGDKVQLSGFGALETKAGRPASAATPTPRRPSIFPLPGCLPSRPARH